MCVCVSYTVYAYIYIYIYIYITIYQIFRSLIWLADVLIPLPYISLPYRTPVAPYCTRFHFIYPILPVVFEFLHYTLWPKVIAVVATY